MTTSPVMELLAGGVPLSLLCDLVATSPPNSHVINAAERPPSDPIWLDLARPQLGLSVSGG